MQLDCKGQRSVNETFNESFNRRSTQRQRFVEPTFNVGSTRRQPLKTRKYNFFLGWYCARERKPNKINSPNRRSHHRDAEKRMGSVMKNPRSLRRCLVARFAR